MAWQIFVVASCPSAASYTPTIAWKNWPEPKFARTAGTVQGGMGGIGAANRMPGRAGVPGITQESSLECMARRPGRTICEEVRVNPAMEEWLSASSHTRPAAPLQTYGSGEMLPPLVEIKADWIKLASCADPPQGAHVELVGSTCYELGGIQMVSELFDRWISATFEVQDMTSNPMRCRVVGCLDPWGSVPSVSEGGAGGNTRISVELSSLMQEANLGSEWLNYRLDEAQISAIDNLGNLMLSKNSAASGAHPRTEGGTASGVQTATPTATPGCGAL